MNKRWFLLPTIAALLVTAVCLALWFSGGTAKLAQVRRMPELGLMTEETDTGLRVLAVVVPSIAERAGFAPGDVLLALDGQPTTSTEELNALLASVRPGDTLVFGIERENAPMELTIQLKKTRLPRLQ